MTFLFKFLALQYKCLDGNLRFWSYPCQDLHASNPHVSWDLWAPQYQCLLAEMAITLCVGVREKKIYWTCKALTPEKQRQMVLIVLSVGIFDILKLQLILLGKFPLLSSVSWTRWEIKSKPFFLSPITWQALMANAFFIPSEYWPLHPILISEYIKI